MTDFEIKQYLNKNNWEVCAQDCLIKVLNTSHQILNTEYNFGTDIMTIQTPENIFTFKWILGRPFG